MIDISDHTFYKYYLFSSLYFTEGIGYIIGIIILPAYLLDKGVDLPLVTLIPALYLIPMTIKFFWGGIVDYFIKWGRRKFIILGGLLFLISFFLLTIIDPKELLPLFGLLLFIAGVGVGFLDVSADAWAIEISNYEERGKINGAMFAGQSLGMVVASTVLTSIAYLYSYNYVFLTTGLILLLIIIFPLLVKDKIKIKKPQKIGKLLIGEFKKKTTLLVSIFTPIVAINIGLTAIVIPLYMQIVLNFNIAEVGYLVTLWAAMRIIGSLIGGALCDKWGRKLVLYLVSIGSGLFTAMMIFANNWIVAAVIYAIIGILHGGQYSALGAMLMDVTNPKVAGTQYSILTSLGNAGMTISESYSGTMVAILGFSRTFLYGAWVFGPALLILYFIKLKIQGFKEKT